MKTKTLLTLVMLFSTVLSISQSLEPFQNNKGKWGLVNNNNKVVVKPKFDNILRFVDNSNYDSVNFFLVNIGGELRKVSHIDSLGFHEVISPSGEYSYEEKTENIDVEYISGGNFGIIDSHGNTILKTKYSNLLLPFYCRYMEDISEKSKYIGLDELHLKHDLDFVKSYIKSEYPIIVCEENKWGQYDFKGNQILEPKYDSVDAYNNIRFYQNSILAVITGINNEIYFKAVTEVLSESDNFLEMFLHNEETGYKDKIYLYFKNSHIENIVLWDTVVFVDPLTGMYIEEVIGNEAISVLKAKIRILDNKGIPFSPMEYDDLYINVKTLDYNTGEAEGNIYINIKARKDVIKRKRINLSNMELASNLVMVEKDNKIGFLNLVSGSTIKLEYDSMEIKYINKSREIYFYTNNVLRTIADSRGEVIYNYSSKDYPYVNASMELKLKSHSDDNALNADVANTIFFYFANTEVDSVTLYDTLYNNYDQVYFYKVQIPIFSNSDITIMNKSGFRYNQEAYDEVYYFTNNLEYIDLCSSYESFDFYYNPTNSGRFISTSASGNFINNNKMLYINGIPDIHYDKIIALKANDWYLINLKTKKTEKIDDSSNTVNLLNYDNIQILENGYMIVEINRKFGFINSSYEYVIDCKFHDIERINDNLFRTQLYFHNPENEYLSYFTYGLANNKGKELLKCEYAAIGNYHDSLASIQLFDSDNKFGAKLKGKYGFIDFKGNIAIECNYDWVEGFYNGLAIVRRNLKSGFINKKGVEVIPCQFDYVENFNDGFAIVVNNGKYGFINLKGELVIPFIYDKAVRFYGDKAKVKKGNQVFYINRNGERVNE